LRALALIALLIAAPLRESFRGTAFSNGDIWWHLQSGLWMLQHHAIPRSGVFSRYPDNPWVASSWAFELLVAAAYKLIGLKAICAVLVVFKAGLAAATFSIVYAARKNFWLRFCFLPSRSMSLLICNRYRFYVLFCSSELNFCS
jgi:hypothetical protein